MKTILGKANFVLLFLCALGLCSCQGFEEQLTYNAANKAHNYGDYDKAIELYEKLLALDPEDKVVPDNSLIRYDLGVAYIEVGNIVKARTQVRKLRQAGSDPLAQQLDILIGKSRKLFTLKAKQAHQKKNYDLAIRLYETAAKIEPKNESVAYDLAVAYIDSGKYSQANRQIERLKELKRSDLAQILTTLLAAKKNK